MERSTISMALFNSYVSLPEGTLMFHRLLLQSPYLRVTGGFRVKAMRLADFGLAKWLEFSWGTETLVPFTMGLKRHLEGLGKYISYTDIYIYNIHGNCQYIIIYYNDNNG